jgi:hypothetical protein
MTVGPGRHELDDPAAAIEFCYEQGWTDGLPVVPPAEDLVERFLTAAGAGPDDLIGTVPTRRRELRAEKVAANAVMAGCPAAAAPLVFTVIRAFCDERFNPHGVPATMMGAAPLIIVNGPVARDLGMNDGGNVFGPGNRVNATVGRMLRLVLLNLCGALPGVLDKSALGQPAKYSYCIAEREVDSPWEPLSVARGLAPGTSAVTLFAATAQHLVGNGFSDTPEGVLTTVASSLASGCRFGSGEYVVVVTPEHARIIGRAGWSRRDVQRFLWERAHRSRAQLKREGRVPGEVQPGESDDLRPPTASPDDILIVHAGGGAGAFTAVITPWVDSRAVTHPLPWSVAGAT